jgi:para-aminobenzoate synthetase component I
VHRREFGRVRRRRGQNAHVVRSRGVDAEQSLCVVGDRIGTGLLDVTSDLSALDSAGFWAVVLPYDGAPVCARFARVRPATPWPGGRWHGPASHEWTSSLDAAQFRDGVDLIRSCIAAGDVYQVNLTRRLSAPLPTRPPAGTTVDIAALGAALAVGNPAPFSAVVRLPAHGIHVASASPELFLQRNGSQVWSSPIKGTARVASLLTPKDQAENVMIVDLVRNDLGRVCDWGSVVVPVLLSVEEHPGLVHLVSTVRGRLRDGTGWPELLDATFPPGSVTGAPKVAACALIDALEPVSRGVYCGGVGWVDADRATGSINVAIRTFWIEDGQLHFGTGGGITYDSDPQREWEETELKAHRLLAVASRDTRVEPLRPRTPVEPRR